MSRIFDIDDDKEEFNIPENATIELSMSPVMPYDLHFIKYSDEFQSFVDVSLISIIIYITTEIYMAFVQPKDEVNLSLVWCAMIVVYGISTLLSIARNYLQKSEGVLLFIFAGISFILSLLIQLADTKFFDFQIKDAFRNISSNTLSLIQNSYQIVESGIKEKIPKNVMSNQNMYSQLKFYSSNDLLFTCFIAFISAIIGALYFFPAFRLAKLHFLSLKYSQGSKLKRLIFYISFILPLLISICWIKLGKSERTTDQAFQTAENSTIQKFINLINPEKDNLNSSILYKIKMFVMNIFFAKNLKIYLILIFFLIRLALFRHYAQSYLNLAYEIAAGIRKQSTKVTNKKYMSSISSIYQYYGVVATQYIIPLYLLLFMGFLLKTLGNYTWCGNMEYCNQFVEMVSSWSSFLKQNSTSSPSLFKRLESSHFNISQSHDAFNKIFTPYVLSSLIGYFTFWTSTIWFLISCFGLFYYHYFDNQYFVEN